MNIKRWVTPRNFDIVEFKDLHDYECSIQKSSLAMIDAIWIGVNSHNAQVLATQANKHGIITKERCGWVEYPIPEGVIITTRMHLSQEQVKELLPILTKFAETGEL